MQEEPLNKLGLDMGKVRAVLCSKHSYQDAYEVKGTWPLQRDRPSFMCAQGKKILQQPRRMPPPVLLSFGTQDTFLTYITLVPNKIKLLNLGLAEYISTVSFMGNGKASLTLKRSSTGEMGMTKEQVCRSSCLLTPHL